jgi:hypothetical protein
MPHSLYKSLVEQMLAEATDVEGSLIDGIGKLVAQGSPRQIALFLTQEGLTGWRHQGYSCPVAKYLNREIGVRQEPLSWNWNVVLVNQVRIAVPIRGVSLPIPPEIGKFVQEFDAGAFNELRPTA